MFENSVLPEWFSRQLSQNSRVAVIYLVYTTTNSVIFQNVSRIHSLGIYLWDLELIYEFGSEFIYFGVNLWILIDTSLFTSEIWKYLLRATVEYETISHKGEARVGYGFIFHCWPEKDIFISHEISVGYLDYPTIGSLVNMKYGYLYSNLYV